MAEDMLIKASKLRVLTNAQRLDSDEGLNNLQSESDKKLYTLWYPLSKCTFLRNAPLLVGLITN